MALSMAPSMLAFAPVMPAVRAPTQAVNVRMETHANKLNPAVGFWDPIGLAKAEFWDNTNEETIGWLRHSEIKHGRVAMAAFVGYCVQANGIKFPWAPFDSITATSPPEQWDALPDVAKWQIILGVGFLEWWSEIRFDGTPHYMKGGKPGYVPPFDAAPEKLPHWVGLNLWDPFKFTMKLSAADKEKKLVTELNNGRLAMIGLFGFFSEAKIPGSVPLLKGVIPAYAGEIMDPGVF